MEEKKADNRLIENKNKMNEINSKLDYEKNKMKRLDDMEELFVSLNKDINKCVELLGESIKGKNVSRKLNSVQENSNINLKKGMVNIEEERANIKQNITKLSNEKDDLIEEMKKEKKEEDN